MTLTLELKDMIDDMSYEELLRGWRFATIGDKWFQGGTGKYWVERMRDMRKAGADHAQASKNIGWKK